MKRYEQPDSPHHAPASKKAPERRLAALVGVDGRTFRSQHQADTSFPPDLLPQVVWGFHRRFDKRFPGCYIVSSDPSHRDLARCPRFSRRGLFTAYRQHRPVHSHQYLAACQRGLLRAIARDDFGGDDAAFLDQVRRLRTAQNVAPDGNANDTFDYWWAHCRDAARKEKYGSRVRDGGDEFEGFLGVIHGQDSARWLKDARTADNAVQAFLIGQLWSRGRRIITIPDATAAEPADSTLVLGPELVSPAYEQHDPLVVVEFGPTAYADRRHGPSFVLLHHSGDRRRIIAAAHVAGTRQLYWSFYERAGAGEPYRRLFAVFTRRDAGGLPADIPGRTERVRACEQGVAQAMREAHAFVQQRAERLHAAPLPGPRPRRRHSEGVVIHQAADHIDQVIRWVKDPLQPLPPQDRVRERLPVERARRFYRRVRPHERQRHYRRQRFGKGRRQVKVIEIRATIVHREWFHGGPGDIDVRYIASRR
jgi:hypothetical protein